MTHSIPGRENNDYVTFWISVHIEILFKEVGRYKGLIFKKSHEFLIPLLAACPGETLLYFHEKII